MKKSLTLSNLKMIFLKIISWKKAVDIDLNELLVEGPSLDKGELSSIVLFKHLKADYLLIDEKIGRRVARLNQVKIIGRFQCEVRTCSKTDVNFTRRF